VVNELQLRYVLGEFELEPETHRLLKSGEQIHLSNKPFKVLTFLIEHRNRIVSREELLEHFWDGHDVYEETLTRCIATIRKALSDSTDIPRFIETKWAEGYRFVHPVEEVASDFEIERTRAIKIVVEEESETQALPSRTVFSWNRA
jgi:DNA-binding winged helix-turn-helix (wHTH) protein